ncbi:hypothetical protein CLOP_g10337 [Closterium sp. NIES-67]|nr:hypothetical protein CLOP_g10337 [Closterium sp. NIES-67]
MENLPETEDFASGYFPMDGDCFPRNTTWSPTTSPPYCSPRSSPPLAAFPRALGALALVASNVAFWVHGQGTGLTLLLAVMWFKAAQLRFNEARRILRQRSKVRDAASLDHAAGAIHPDNQRSHDAQQHAQQQAPWHAQRRGVLPKVSVVLAVKGSAGDAGMSNWRSQVRNLYGGATEYIFCVESARDPACRAVKALQRELRGTAEIRLVVAGLASRCSQQIHNQLAGAKRASADSKYLLFLDDDIQCHPGTLGLLVSNMEANPNALVCTGYSFDIPQTRDLSLAAYAAMAYRVPIQLAMASGGKQIPVWGGCMMIRLDDLRADRYGMATALSAHGYSNDLILSAVAASNGRDVVCPAAAIFPGRLAGRWTFRRYWNYVRRQTYALTTFRSPVALALNSLGFALYGYGAFCLVASLLPSALQVSLALVSLARGGAVFSPWNPDWSRNPGIISPTSLTDVSSASSGASNGVVSAAMGFVLANASLLTSLVYCAAFILSTLAVICLFRATIALCNLLSPEKPPIRAGDISLALGVAGMLLNLAVVPVVSVYTLLQPAITWAGITYVRRRGLIVHVRHPRKERQQGQQQGGDGEEWEGKGAGGMEEAEGEEEDPEEEEHQQCLPPLAASPVSSCKPAGLVAQD